MRRLSARGAARHASSLVGGGAISELAYATSRRCRCGTLLLYQAPELRGSGFRIMSLTCGAMGIRTPDLLHAIQRQPVHSSPSPQVTVPSRPLRSTRVRACCGTFLLYGPMPPTACSSAESCSGQRREIPCCHAPDFTHLPKVVRALGKGMAAAKSPLGSDRVMACGPAVPKWYHSVVAMNLRLDDEDSALLRALAEAEQVSLHEAVLRAIRRSARDVAHTARVRDATAEMLDRWGEVLDRLGRA
jgi:uncharacterized protein (DUF1778 family)